MFRRYLLIAVLLIVGLGATDSFAQRRLPSRPSISPYVNLFNNTTGGVNNYFQFVRPLQQQARINQRQFNQTARLQRQLLQPQVGGAQVIGPNALPATGLLRPGTQGVGVPTQAATFFDYSHFYSIPRTQGGAGNRRRGNQF